MYGILNITTPTTTDNTKFKKNWELNRDPDEPPVAVIASITRKATIA